MTVVVTVIDAPRTNQQSLFVCRRNENRPCWKDVSRVNLKVPLFRMLGNGQGSRPQSISHWVNDMEHVFVVQAVAGANGVELRAVVLRLVHGVDGMPVTPTVTVINPFPLHGWCGGGGKSTVLDRLTLALDEEKVWALSSGSTPRLFRLGVGEKKWDEVPLGPGMNPCTLSPCGLLFSASLMTGAGCLSTRQMLDLRECVHVEHVYFAPYTIENDDRVLPIRVMDAHDLVVKDLKELHYLPADNMYFSANASGPVLLTGQTYKLDLSLGGTVYATDRAGAKVMVPFEKREGKVWVNLTPAIGSVLLGPVRQLDFNVQGSEMVGLRVGHRYILVDHVVMGTNRISEVAHGVKTDLVAFGDKDERMHGDVAMHQFARSGDVMAVETIRDNVYIRTRHSNDQYALNQLWLLKGNTVELVCSLKTGLDAFVFAKTHSVNPFNTHPSPKVCLNALFSGGRLFTCTCAGGDCETNRSADAFTGRKGYFKNNWDLFYMRGSPDPVEEDSSVHAMMVFG